MTADQFPVRPPPSKEYIPPSADILPRFPHIHTPLTTKVFLAKTGEYEILLAVGVKYWNKLGSRRPMQKFLHSDRRVPKKDTNRSFFCSSHRHLPHLFVPILYPYHEYDTIHLLTPLNVP